MDSSSDCAGVLTGWLWDGCGIPISSLLLNFNFLLILEYGVYGIHWRFFYVWRTGFFSVLYRGFVFDV